MRPVDVIVPVYRGADSARRCIESVMAARQQTPYELVVVGDAPPDVALVAWLRELAQQGRITLLEQPARLGFAAAVNRAVALHADTGRDVVILNSDAEVANDWLDRLATHAASACDIGTVAPFASCGGVAGYPLNGVRNALPDGHTVASLDLLFRRANAGAAIGVPLSCGPCVYLRRECLAAVGVLDGGLLSGDDGVEQDFCLRATSACFRHLLAADVFVGHRSAQAFGPAEAREFAASAEAVTDKIFAQYPGLRAEFARRDPVRPFQRRVDLLRLAESPRHLLLFVAHAWGGGLRRHMAELSAMAGVRCNVLLLEPAVGDTVKLSWLKEGEGFCAYFTLPGASPALASLLRAAGVARVHFHHVHALPRAVLELPAAVGVPYDCTLHDSYAICPQYHLVTEEGRYCGEPDAAGCAACLARRPGQWGLDIDAWRGVFGRLLRGAERVIAPSRDVARRMARYFPEIELTILAHAEEALTALPQITKVVTLGNLSPEKGLRVAAACAEDARARKLPLAFRVLGSTTAPVPLWPQAPLSIHGQYADDELPSILATERPDVIWFPAQIPETYSYTLSVAIAAGVPIVAAALGVFPERLAGHDSAMLLPWDATPAAWNEALLRAGQDARATARPAIPKLTAS
jgi:GT2 family glycosyltransferase/glycosyltransferase involved in cell wall biosynthesis